MRLAVRVATDFEPADFNVRGEVFESVRHVAANDVAYLA